MEQALVHFTQARQALQKAKTIDEVKAIKDAAERLRLYLKQSKESLEMQNDAAEIGLRAERRAGEMLKESKEARERASKGQPKKEIYQDGILSQPVTLKEIGISPNQSSRWQAIASIPETEFENTIGQAKIAGQELTRSMLLNIAKEQQAPERSIVSQPPPRPEPAIINTERPHVAHNSGNNEWYTPAEYVEAARTVLGEIDLDPASSKVANRIVRAKKFYTAEDDGLSKDWRGHVWMNPPYSGDLISRFTSKLCQHVRTGAISEAIVLVNNATETQWFQEALALVSAICFPKGRIRYLDSTGTPANTPLQGQAFLYFGKQANSFKKIFSRFGGVR